MRHLILLIVLFCVFLNAQAEVTVTPSEVYGQVLLIEQETELIKRHFKLAKKPTQTINVVIDIQPRYVWEKCYMLQMKMMVFRRKYQMGAISPVDVEPTEHITNIDVWAQTQRTITVTRIIRKALGIQGEVGEAPKVNDKKLVDVFNKLAQIEAEWDILSDASFNASYSFDQALRLNEDVDLILRQLSISDNAIAPAKNSHDTPANSLAQAFLVLQQVQRLQKLAGMEIADLSVFRKTEKVTPADVFNMICLTLADVQQIKARIGLNHAITPTASYHEGKKPADVRQFLGYITNKLTLIEHL